MRINTNMSYGFEIASGAAALGLFVGGALLGGFDAQSPQHLLGVTGLSGALLALGVSLGAMYRSRGAHIELAERDERIGELSERPERERFAALETDLAMTAESLESARAELTSLSEELACAAACCHKLDDELAATRVTVQLDHFSAFQLLNMCDICDAEDACGYLERELNDPGMEQLAALDVVLFSHTQDGGSTLKWTLKPQWRAAIKANRPMIDDRTAALRERRGDVVGPASRES